MSKSDNIAASFRSQRNHARGRQRTFAPTESTLPVDLPTAATELRLAVGAHHFWDADAGHRVHMARVALACAEDMAARKAAL